MGINPLKGGDVFVTSGSGGLYPPGIPVAVVTEVLVDGDKFAIVAERISPETILAAEHVPDWLK
jgi:rod shape-determining protein MreC